MKLLFKYSTFFHSDNGQFYPFVPTQAVYTKKYRRDIEAVDLSFKNCNRDATKTNRIRADQT